MQHYHLLNIIKVIFQNTRHNFPAGNVIYSCTATKLRVSIFSTKKIAIFHVFPKIKKQEYHGSYLQSVSYMLFVYHPSEKINN